MSKVGTHIAESGVVDRHKMRDLDLWVRITQ